MACGQYTTCLLYSETDFAIHKEWMETFFKKFYETGDGFSYWVKKTLLKD